MRLRLFFLNVLHDDVQATVFKYSATAELFWVHFSTRKNYTPI